jgi:hypothetical protein
MFNSVVEWNILKEPIVDFKDIDINFPSNSPYRLFVKINMGIFYCITQQSIKLGDIVIASKMGSFGFDLLFKLCDLAHECHTVIHVHHRLLEKR